MTSGKDPVYLIFRAGGGEFALRAEAVRAMHWLPELAPARSMHSSVIGIFQRSGRAVPVIDLGRLFHGADGGYHLSDVVIVSESGKRRIGILAEEVKRLAQGTPLRFDAPETATRTEALIAGELDVDGDIATLIEPESLLAKISAAEEAPGGGRAFWPDATPEERDLLRQRSATLRHPVDTGLSGSENRLAIVRVGNELLAVDMAQVREFADIGPTTPVPCTPAYIVGNTNLRGSIVTVVDLLSAMGMSKRSTEKTGKMIVVQHEGLLAGFPVNEVLDVMALEEKMLKPGPGDSGFVKGEMVTDRGLATFVDLQRLVTAEELIVDEQVVG